MSDISALWDLIEQGRKGNNIGTSTGLSKLDKIIGGIQPSRYYLIGAASSVGKTAFVLYMMYQILKNESIDAPVYFIYFSLEIGSDILLAKLMALYCAEEFGIYLTIDNILSFQQKLDDYSYNCLVKAKAWLESINKYIVILDEGLSARILYRRTIETMQNFGDIINKDGIDVFVPANSKQKVIGVIDHCNLVKCEEGRTKKGEIDTMSAYMVTLKRKFKISWFALMQQNRESSSMDRRKADLSEPGLNDLKETGTTSEDADVVLQLFFPFREKLSTYRGYKILNDGLKQNHRSIIISKNRYGIANQVINLSFYGSVGWFNELPAPDQITDYSIYLTEQGNIPCKIKQETTDEVSKDDVQEKQTVKFSF